jgi:hypothetical protein
MCSKSEFLLSISIQHCPQNAPGRAGKLLCNWRALSCAISSAVVTLYRRRYPALYWRAAARKNLSSVTLMAASSLCTSETIVLGKSRLCEAPHTQRLLFPTATRPDSTHHKRTHRRPPRLRAFERHQVSGYIKLETGISTHRCPPPYIGHLLDIVSSLINKPLRRQGKNAIGEWPFPPSKGQNGLLEGSRP